MSVNGKFDHITRSDLLELAQRNNIKDAASIIDMVTDGASQWPTIAKECEVPQSMIDAIVPNMLLSL